VEFGGLGSVPLRGEGERAAGGVGQGQVGGTPPWPEEICWPQGCLLI
jgi:hypothetical protein